MSTDDVFFGEWDTRHPGDRRSLDRARLLIAELGLSDLDLPILTIVGSKGKGTAAAYASAYVSAAGRHVITITSPSYRTTRERIRIDGRALPCAEMRTLAGRIAVGIQRLPGRAPGQGYLAPSGLFTIAGVLHAHTAKADLIVLEAGRGGRSDEASLFPPTVAAVTPIFDEHLGELGDSVSDIARNKASVIGPATQTVLSSPQREPVERVLRTTVAEISKNHLQIDVVRPRTSGIPTGSLAPGLGAINAELGCMAGQRLLDAADLGRPDARMLQRALSSVRLPGRLSWHRVPGTGTSLLVDQAVNRAAAAAALATATARHGRIDHVLLSLSDDKDLAGIVTELDGLPVTFVRLNRSHLRFSRSVPRHWTTLSEEDLTVDLFAGLGRVLAMGTVSFVALMLELLDVETDQLFAPPVPTGGSEDAQ